MEILNQLLQAIFDNGFSVVMCLLLLYKIEMQDRRYREDMQGMETRHREDMKNMTEALDNNTSAMHTYTNTFRDLLEQLRREHT